MGGYFLDRVRVDGVTIPSSNYNLSGQNVTFINTNSFSPGDLIQFDLVHTDNGMTTSQILQTINNAGITGLTASLSAQNTIQLDLTSTNLSATLTVSPGTTNSDLGFPSNGQTANVVVGID